MKTMAVSPEVGAIMLLLFAQAAAGAALVDTPVWEKADLRAYTIIGCVIGSFLSVIIFPPEGGAHAVRNLGIKFFTSLSLGVLFTPLIIRYFDMPRDVDIAMAIGGGWSIFSAGVVHKVAPYIERFAVARAEALSGKGNKE